MKNHFFDGKSPIEILGFLRRLKTQCDLNNITEGTAALFLPEFLEEPVRSEFISYNAVGAAIGEMYSFPQAIHVGVWP